MLILLPLLFSAICNKAFHSKIYFTDIATTFVQTVAIVLHVKPMT